LSEYCLSQLDTYKLSLSHQMICPVSINYSRGASDYIRLISMSKNRVYRFLIYCHWLLYLLENNWNNIFISPQYITINHRRRDSWTVGLYNKILDYSGWYGEWARMFDIYLDKNNRNTYFSSNDHTVTIL